MMKVIGKELCVVLKGLVVVLKPLTRAPRKMEIRRVMA
jgi:hypothetical protein